LQELQSNEGLRASKKLHELHTQWNRPKMKVKVAAQTPSSFVADAIAFVTRPCNYDISSFSATVNFIKIID